MGRPRRVTPTIPISGPEVDNLSKVLDDAIKALDKPAEPPKPKPWNKRYAELLSLYRANDGDEATQQIILATLDAIGLKKQFEDVLKVDEAANDELFAQLERALARLSTMGSYAAESWYTKTLAVLRSRCKEEE